MPNTAKCIKNLIKVTLLETVFSIYTPHCVFNKSYKHSLKQLIQLCITLPKNQAFITTYCFLLLLHAYHLFELVNLFHYPFLQCLYQGKKQHSSFLGKCIYIDLITNFSLRLQ